MCALCGTRMQASWQLLCKCGTPEITYGHAIHASQTILIKINHHTFEHPKYENCKPECAKKVLIAMHNENKANCNENFRICAEEPVAPLYKQ